MEELETIPAWELEKVKSKKEVILEAQRDKKKVHFDTLMDIHHLKNAEVEPKYKKKKKKKKKQRKMRTPWWHCKKTTLKPV